MISSEQANEVSVEVAELSREEVIRRIEEFNGGFRLDFTHEFLNGKTTNELRHILFAALCNCNK